MTVKMKMCKRLDLFRQVSDCELDLHELYYLLCAWRYSLVKTGPVVFIP